MPIPSHHNPGDPGHAADHNAIVDTLTAHDQAVASLQGTTQGIFYLAGNNTCTITGTSTSWAVINLPTGNRDTAVDTYQIFHGPNKIFWFDGYGYPRVKNDDPTHVPLTIDSVAGQTASLQEWRFNGTTVAAIQPDGTILAPNTVPGTWLDMPLNSGIVAYGHDTHNPQYRIVNDRVELRGVVAKSNGSNFTSSPVTIATLPANARPTALSYAVIGRQFVDVSGFARLQVDSSGTINVYFYTGDPPGWMALDCSFSLLGE